MNPHHPAWRNPDNYPRRGVENRLALAWEFLRRNRLYAQHVEQMQKWVATGEYDRGVKKRSTACLDGLTCWPPAHIRETARDYYQRTQVLGEKRGSKIIVPKHTFINLWALERPVSVDTPYDPQAICFVRHND